MRLRESLGLLGADRDFERLMERVSSGAAASNGAVVSAAAPLRPFLIAGITERLNRPVLIVTARPAEAERFARDAGAYLPEVRLLPAPETLAHEPISPSPVAAGRRLAALDALASDKKVLVVAPIAAVLRRIPALEYRLHEPLVIVRGDELDMVDALSRLGDLGYARRSIVEGRGEFGVRGGIIDVFPTTADHPVRIEFYGDDIESLREFSVASQRTIGELSSVEMYGCREMRIERQALTRAAEGLASMPWFAEEAGLLREGLAFEGVERFTPLIYERLVTPLDYLGKDSTIVLDSPNDVIAEAARFLELARREVERAATAGEAPSTDYYAEYVIPKGRATIELVTSMVAGEDGISFESKAAPAIMGQLDKLPAAVGELAARGLSVVIALNDAGQIRRVAELLEGGGISAVSRGCLAEPGVHLAEVDVSAGFVFEDAGVALLAYSDLFFRRHERRVTKVGVRLTDLADLDTGDFVVHTAHGIARYGGLVKRSLDGVERDYMLLEYAASDKLFVPVDQLDRVGKYIGTDGEPTVTRLGGTDWLKAKKKAKESARKMAIDLLSLYAVRAKAKGFTFSTDTPWQRELEEAFPFQETPDQLAAIDEVKKDMEDERPMDRLVCGDVGYGKTEVALRAAFKAVMDGKQVVVLVPTTILAQQHYETFRERFAPFPVVVEVLSRFRSVREQKEIIERFAEGKVDVVIGTHRVLSPDVAAKNLGLIIVDEEQRFGVAAKEKLKNIKKSVDVLTLSATPIPRTLQMSLSGLRDLTVIETPPEDRHPIATYVGPFDDGLVADAVRREISRGGQCFFVHNHIESIEGIAEHLHRLVPEAIIAVAHGRMAEKRLEKVMVEFLEGRLDVLISTTIIENGLDIPSVNTLIVDRADLLGLAQLYQLRGRVGRSDERAHAYFFYEPRTLILPQALERLKTISEATDLGSGMKIALRDLEIRGAGSLLGAEQHGQVASVGFELYCDLLREAVEEFDGKPHVERPDIAIDLPLDAYLPEDYVSEERLRIEAYRKLARAGGVADIDALEAELNDRYGAPPAEAINLLHVARLKQVASTVGVTAVRWSRGAIVLSGPRFGPEWGEAAKSVDPGAELSVWLGRSSIVGVDKGDVLSFLLKMFSVIMAEFQGPE